MHNFLGIDTSNYTTSVAVYNSQTKTIQQEKQLLPVKSGARGLRQSEALFHHTAVLPTLLEKLSTCVPPPYQAVGASAVPRNAEGSYMPCFLAGVNAAKAVSCGTGIPYYAFSHQCGHIAAALFSAKRMDLIDKKFIAFHVSGGTTEALLVTPDTQHVLHAACIARSTDLHAGQAIDRVGVMLGLDFPCGRDLDRLAAQCTQTYHVKPAMRGGDCCLSGIENQCRRQYEKGDTPENIARYCIDSVLAAVNAMTQWALREYGDLPLVYAGGVMSNTIIRRAMQATYDAYFAQPDFSCDNAAGIAILTAYRYA